MKVASGALAQPPGSPAGQPGWGGRSGRAHLLTLEFCKSYHKAFARCCHGTSEDYTDFTDQSVSHKKAQKAGRDSQGNPFCASCAFSLQFFSFCVICVICGCSLLISAYCLVPTAPVLCPSFKQTSIASRCSTLRAYRTP